MSDRLKELQLREIEAASKGLHTSLGGETHFLLREIERRDARIAELTREAARSRWQTIETAPRDGTLIILARYGWANDPGDAVPGDPEYRKRIFDNSRRTHMLWWLVKGHWSIRWNNWNDGIEPSGLNQPTHWQPLPEPPSCP